MGLEAFPRPQRARTQPRKMVEAADDSEIDAATHWIHQSTSLQQSALPPGARPPLGSRPPPLPRPKARRSKATRGPSSCRSSPCSSPSQQQDDSDYEDAVSDADAEWAAAAAALGRAPPEAGADSGSHQADSPDAPAYKRRRGSSGKAVKLRNPEYTEEERAELARKSRKRLQDKTLKSYDSHLRKLEAFCNIQGFTLAAAQDAMQVVTIMAKFIAWVANNMPCFNYRGKKESMSFGLLRAVRNAAVLKYNQLCISNGWSDARELMATREFKVEFMNGCALVLPKKGRPVGDPQKNTAAESLTDEEVMACFHWWLSQGDIASTRDWAANLACLKGIGRSDDTLPVYLADLAAPRPQKVIGEADCLVHRTVLRGGKRTAAGEVQWYDWIPASEPELCPVTAEAAYLALRFEIQQQPVPDISTKDGLLEFWSMPLYHGANFTAALHYEAHAAAVTKVFRENGIENTKKTHAWRVFSVQALDAAGFDDMDKLRAGRWASQGASGVMNGAYLDVLPPGVLLCIGGGIQHKSQDVTRAYFADRLCVVPPDDLLQEVFPNMLGALVGGIKKLVAAHQPVPKSAANLAIRLQALRITLIQSALVLAPRYPEHPVFAWLMQKPRFKALLNEFSLKQMKGVYAAQRTPSQDDKLDRISKGLGAQTRAMLASLTGGQLPAEVGKSLQATATVLCEDRLPDDEVMRQRAARLGAWQAAARRGIAAAQRGDAWADVQQLDREEQTASEVDLDQLALVALSMEEAQRQEQQEAAGTAAGCTPAPAAGAAAVMPTPAAAAGMTPVAAAAAVLMPTPAAAAGMTPVAAAAPVLMPTPAAAAGMTPVEAAAAAAVAVADQPGDNTVEVPVALLQQLMAQQQSLQQQLLLLTAEVCVSGPPALHRAAAAAQQDDSVSLSAGSKGVFTLGYATSASSGTGTMARARSAAGYATAAAAPAAAASASARGSFVSRWAGLVCNLPRNGLSLVPSATWAATLYYEGHNGYPAWKDREEEQEQASQRGELGPQQSWRSGRRRTWHQFVRAMQLVEEVAKREQCTPIQAAKLVDQCLEARQVGKARKKSFACLGRSDKAESVRQMLGLPAKPESS